MALGEPEWMKGITSNTICTYFYILFLIVAVAAAVVVLSDLAYVVGSGGRRGYMLLIRSLVALALPIINALFLYIMCARSLLERR
jgi:hypothetical protein